MLGGGPYEATTCPECGSTMWNGRCENPDCKYHWQPKEEEGEDEGRSEKMRRCWKRTCTIYGTLKRRHQARQSWMHWMQQWKL